MPKGITEESKSEWGGSKFEDFVPYESVEKRFFAGYKKEVEAGLALGLYAYTGQLVKAFIFGFPGCGKSEYPYYLTYQLNQLGYKYSLLYIKCHRLASACDQVAMMKSYLRERSNEIRKFLPIIVVFDELDAISPTKTTPGSSLKELTSWTMSFLANGSQESTLKKVMVFGITNYPSEVDQAVLDRFQHTLYFDPPTEEVVKEMLEHQGFIRSERLARKLIQQISSHGQTVTGRGIMLACKTMRCIAEITSEDWGKCLSSKSDEDISQELLINLNPVDTREIDIYTTLNRGRIDHSKRVILYWAQQLQRLQPHVPLV